MSNARILVLALIGFFLSIASIFLLDQRVEPYALASSPAERERWELITELGNATWMALLLIATWMAGFIFHKISPENPFWLSMRKKSLIVLMAVAGTGAVTMVLKVIVGRARPYMMEYGFFPFTFGSDFASWPSGHATTAFAFAMAAGMAIPVLRWPLLALAAVVGYSRMVIGVHYLGDIIMGATIGALGAVLIYRWMAARLGLEQAAPGEK